MLTLVTVGPLHVCSRYNYTLGRFSVHQFDACALSSVAWSYAGKLKLQGTCVHVGVYFTLLLYGCVCVFV